MPDHEEAVREARSDVAIIGGLGSKVGGIESLEYFEESIRASERAKYAALVDAAGIRCGGMHQTTLTTEVAEWCSDPICVAARVAL